MNLKNYWDKAISIDEYLSDIKSFVADKKEDEHWEHYHINLKRMERILRTQKSIPDLSDINSDLRLLIITEGWCGDASQIIPVIEASFKLTIEIRYIYRDENPDLMNEFLTGTSASIPIVIVLDKDYNVVNKWGPRPSYLNSFLVKYKSQDQPYTKEEFINDIQIAYNKDKGMHIVSELMQLLK